jgi:hypothetical protein
MEERSTAKVKVRHHMGTPVHVGVTPGGAVVTPVGQKAVHVDLVLMALHADDALKALRFDGIPADTVQAIEQTLGQVRYTRSHGVCHTDERLLPPNRNIWRTYNVQVYPLSQQAQPYRMSYVENFHQNDPLNPPLDHIGLPMFFTSLVPDLRQVRANAVLPRLQGEAVPQHLRQALPHLARTHGMDLAKAAGDPHALDDDAALAPAHPATGYTHELSELPSEHAGKAWALFKHNVLDIACIEAQARMLKINQDNAKAPLMPVFFGGGWTRGAGLHEQCLEQSQWLTRWALDYIGRHQQA